MLRWPLALVLILVLVGVLAWLRDPVFGQRERIDPKADDDRNPNAVAVVELFTSEGCSSCPPADELLGELARDARRRSQPVYCLSFHVDYWNRLGWADPYSDAAYSRRQDAYVRALKLDGPYTPQMVVNGTTEFVGSDRRRARGALDGALKQAARTAVRVRQEKSEAAEQLVVRVKVDKVAPGTILHVAAVEPERTSRVPRGENAGRTLTHVNVVRAFRSVKLDDDGDVQVELKLPAGFDRKKSQVVAYVQDGVAGAILGATATEVDADGGR